MLLSRSLRTFLQLLYSILALPVSAQLRSFEHLGADRGLPASEAYNIARDEKGYIWVATEYGLVKYNGARFVPVCTNIPLRERIVYAFSRNSKSELCFANSQFNIYVTRNDSAFMVKGSGKVKAGMPNYLPIGNFYIDSTDNIYLHTFARSYKYLSPEDTLVERASAGGPVPLGTIEEIGKNYFSVLTSNDALHFSIPNPRYAGVFRLEGLSGEGRSRVQKNNYGMYLTLDHYIVLVTGDRKTYHYQAPGAVLSLNLSPGGHVWAGVQNEGLLELDKDLRLLHRYLPGLSVSDVHFDDQDGIWTTTLEQGVFHCRNVHEYSYYHPEGSTEITLLKPVGNRLFAGSSDGKLLVLDGERSQLITMSKNSNMQDVLALGDGYLLATKSGTYSLPTLSGVPRLMIPGVCYRMLRQWSGIISLRGTLLTVYTDDFREIDSARVPAKSRCLLPLSDSTLLFGTEKGCIAYKDGRFSFPADLSPLQNSDISVLAKDTEGTIWIGTRGDGLFRLRRNSPLEAMTAPSGMITHLSFYRDSLLLSTNTGLYAAAPASAMKWKMLYSGEVMKAVAYRDKIFIGTKHGLLAYDTAALFRPLHPAVYLSSVTAKGRRTGTTGIHVQHGENELLFGFDVLSYRRQAPPLLYRLNGPVTSEGQVPGTQLLLQNLPPGRYELLLYTDSGSLQPSLIVPFYIEPAFWQTRTFFAGSIVLGVLLLLASGYWLHRRTRNVAYKKATIGRLLSEYKLTALKAQINPHFISNSLAAIQQLVLSGEVEKGGHYLAQFSLLIRCVLQYSDKSLVSLGEELKIIELNILLEQLRFSDHFIFEKDIRTDADLRDLFVPPLITQPFIENAVWHGLLPLRDRRMPKLVFKIRQYENRIVLSITDNGVGRSMQAKAGEKPENGPYTSRGIALTQSRIENLNQLYGGIQGQMRITDLYDEHRQPAGTQVDITLPIISDPTHEINHPQHHY